MCNMVRQTTKQWIITQDILYYNCITFLSIKWQTTIYIYILSNDVIIYQRTIKIKQTRERESTVWYLKNVTIIKMFYLSSIADWKKIKCSVFSQMKSRPICFDICIKSFICTITQKVKLKSCQTYFTTVIFKVLI